MDCYKKSSPRFCCEKLCDYVCIWPNFVICVKSAIVLATAPYPPFGLVTVSFVGLSSYLMLVGIYSSAISVSEDVIIRQTIRKSVNNESELLGSIGSSHMQQELERRVLKITKSTSDLMEEQTGVEPSITEGNMKEYLQEVLTEVKRSRS